MQDRITVTFDKKIKIYKNMLQKNHNQAGLAFLFLAPSILVLLFFLVFPIISGLWMCLQRTSLSGISSFAGIDNFKLLFTEERFFSNLTLTVVYVAGNILLSLPAAYFAASFIVKKMRGAGFIRTVFLIPWIIPPIVSAVLFRSLVDPVSGPAADLLSSIFGEDLIILGDGNFAMATIIVHSFWRSFPFMMLFLAAGMAAIPRDIYEASEVDGANAWTKFSRITFPLTKIHLALVLIIISMWTMQDAETVYAMTEGGPGNSTEVLAIRLFRESFLNFDMNMGAAIGVILVLLGVVFMAAYLRLGSEGKGKK